MDVLELCKKYQHEGVVAIDLAGDEILNSEGHPEHRSAYEVSKSKRTARTCPATPGKTLLIVTAGVSQRTSCPAASTGAECDF